MSGIIIEPATSIEAIERNFARLNEAVVALQGGSIAIENIEGYENLATKLYVEEEVENIRYAVGDIHISETDEDPADKFGYGEWKLISKGRTLVGIDVAPEEGDEDYDPEYEVDQDFQAPGQEGGEKEHTLIVEELPEHTHGSGVHSGKYNSLDDSGANWQTGKELRSPEYSTSSTGDGEPHNNLQPYYCVYFWKRIA